MIKNMVGLRKESTVAFLYFSMVAFPTQVLPQLKI
jgi:hypothetical protein